MIWIGRIAEKYGMLPSEVVEKATTYDMMVSDVLATYEQYLDAKANNQQLDPSAFNYDEDELQLMMENARGNKHNKKT